MAGHAPKLWSSPPKHNPGKANLPRLALNNLPEARDGLSVPLGFLKNKGNHFHIKTLQNTTGKTLFLEDIIGQQLQLLCPQKKYHFTAEETDPPQRFILHFTTGTPPIPSWEKDQTPTPHIYATREALYFNTFGDSCMLGVFNLQGMRIIQTQQQHNGKHRLTHNLPPGIYVASFSCNTTKHAVKLFVP